MRRREFITLLGCAAAASPLGARAQGDRMRRVGVLIGSDDNTEARALFAGFQQALEQLGWIYGRNIQIDIRWGSDPERIIAYTKELVRLNPDVIFAGPTNVVVPLQRETRSIPIVFIRVADPVGQGIVESLARPNGNVTGFSNFDFPLGRQMAANPQGYRAVRDPGRPDGQRPQCRFGVLLQVVRDTGTVARDDAH